MYGFRNILIIFVHSFESAGRDAQSLEENIPDCLTYGGGADSGIAGGDVAIPVGQSAGYATHAVEGPARGSDPEGVGRPR